MHIAIIAGGTTAEREVSIASANNIQKVIDFAETKLFVFPEEQEVFVEISDAFDLVIPMIHGAGGEDGELQKFLDTQNIPYIFSGIAAHSVGINKTKTKEIVRSLVSVPKEYTISDGAYPIFAKPRFGGSSVASKFCHTREELNQLIAENPEIDFMFEEPIKGREFTVGVIESKGETLPLPVIEIIPKGDFFDFETKYGSENNEREICPAHINEVLSEKLQAISLAVHKEIGAKHISRSDFIVTPENEIYFLEINTIPGMTAASLVPKMLKEANLSLGDLLKEWCENIA